MWVGQSVRRGHTSCGEISDIDGARGIGQSFTQPAAGLDSLGIPSTEEFDLVSHAVG